VAAFRKWWCCGSKQQQGCCCISSPLSGPLPPAPCRLRRQPAAAQHGRHQRAALVGRVFASRPQAQKAHGALLASRGLACTPGLAPGCVCSSRLAVCCCGEAPSSGYLLISRLLLGEALGASGVACSPCSRQAVHSLSATAAAGWCVSCGAWWVWGQVAQQQLLCSLHVSVVGNRGGSARKQWCALLTSPQSLTGEPKLPSACCCRG
jgi:hypothetical protein